MAELRLLIFGLGYTRIRGHARCHRRRLRRHRNCALGWRGDPLRLRAAASIAQSTHLLSTVPPDVSGDPVLSRYANAIDQAAHLRWIGYLSSTGVYGDRRGDWVDEGTQPAPVSDRSRRRLAAEQAWGRLADRCGVDVFRLAGIYGPAR